jgi:hypothetical protein
MESTRPATKMESPGDALVVYWMMAKCLKRRLTRSREPFLFFFFPFAVFVCPTRVVVGKDPGVEIGTGVRPRETQQ